MLLKTEFYHMCNQLGLEDSDLSLAEIVWDRAERAMQGKPVQQAKLLKSEVFTACRKSDKHALTQDELQYLTDGLARVLKYDQEELDRLKTTIDFFWRESEPEQKESRKYFIALNGERDLQRKLKKNCAKLSQIQHKLKKQKSK